MPPRSQAVACHMPIRLKGRPRTLIGPSPDLSQARALAPSVRCRRIGYHQAARRCEAQHESIYLASVRFVADEDSGGDKLDHFGLG
jgi:hypothetical protein